MKLAGAFCTREHQLPPFIGTQNSDEKWRLAYHRIANPRTQSFATAKMQLTSGEVWGVEHRGGSFPSVRAWRGDLHAEFEGIQFTTNIEPDKFTPNNLAVWRLPEHGGAPQVEKRTLNGATAACVKVEIHLTRYACRSPEIGNHGKRNTRPADGSRD